MARFLLVFGILECFWISGYGTLYDNHTLMKIYTTTEEQLLAANRFHDPEGEVEVLKPSRGLNDTLDLLVPPDKLQYVDDFGKHYGLTISIKQNNYGRKFEEIPSERTPRRRLLRDFNVFAYHSFNEMNEYLEWLAARHPDVLHLHKVGHSYEGRPMILAFISLQPNAGNPAIFIDAGVHSREWVAPAMAMFLIDRLVSDPSSRKRGGALHGVDWLILPLVNPDGYEFSRSDPINRMWRKTRSKIEPHAQCIGVDGNRNYGFQWAVSGVSHDPCHKETYCGPKPFSEPETQIVKNIMLQNKNVIKLYVSLHAYGQYLVYPWGYTDKSLPSKWRKLDTLAKLVSEAVQRAGGQPFRVMSAGKWYPAAGGSDDYAFGAANIPYSYTMELTEGHEFVFPERLLAKALPEFYEGFKKFASQIRLEFGLN